MGVSGEFDRDCWLVVVVVVVAVAVVIVSGEFEGRNKGSNRPKFNKSPNHKTAKMTPARASQRTSSLLKTNEGRLDKQEERPASEGKERCKGSMVAWQERVTRRSRVATE